MLTPFLRERTILRERMNRAPRSGTPYSLINHCSMQYGDPQQPWLGKYWAFA